jgi:hypothetical protein
MDKGDIVTVLSGAFEGAQGKIVGIRKGGIIRVLISKAHEYMLGFCSSDREKIIRFTEKELRQDSDWTSEVKAIQLFGKKMFHSLRLLPKPFNPETECMCEGCSKKATSRIMVNLWGLIYEFDVCDEDRKKYHGKGMDCFPAKNG